MNYENRLRLLQMYLSQPAEISKDNKEIKLKTCGVWPAAPSIPKGSIGMLIGMCNGMAELGASGVSIMPRKAPTYCRGERQEYFVRTWQEANV